MKKILIVTTVGGFLQQFEMNDVNILREQGYKIYYMSNLNNPVYELDYAELSDMEIELHSICIQKSPFHIWENAKAFKEICHIVKKEEIEVLHCHNPMGGVLGRLAALYYRRKQIYVIYTAHGFHFYKGAPLLNWLLYYPIEYLLAKCTDCLITINKEDYKRACRFAKGKNKQVYQIPGVGVDTGKFFPGSEVRKQVREEFHIEEDTFYILSVGELNHNKNHEVILRAIAMIGDKKIHYGVCGRGYHKEYLEQLAVELGIRKQVTLFGFRNDIPRMLQCADCFAFPSIREGFGIAALEAMAAGIPMITSDCRGTREYMEDGKTGYVCQTGTAKEYAKLICKMKDNEKKRAKMSIECRHMAQRFDISETDKIMKKIYKQLPP